MTSERYECVCTTCEATEVLTELDRAQERFNEHAARGCEVVLRNVTPATNPTAAGSPAMEE